MRELIEELETKIGNYFGSLNEIRLGIRKTPDEKPAELIVYEQIVEMGIPLVEGGVQDQPHIWLMQYATCMNQTQLWRRIIDEATKPHGQIQDTRSAQNY